MPNETIVAKELLAGVPLMRYVATLSTATQRLPKGADDSGAGLASIAIPPPIRKEDEEPPWIRVAVATVVPRL